MMISQQIRSEFHQTRHILSIVDWNDHVYILNPNIPIIQIDQSKPFCVE